MTSELAPADAVPATTSVSLGAALAMSAPTVLVAPVDVAESEPDSRRSEPPDTESGAAQGPTAATASAEISARRAAGTTQKTVTVAVLATDADTPADASGDPEAPGESAALTTTEEPTAAEDPTDDPSTPDAAAAEPATPATPEAPPGEAPASQPPPAAPTSGADQIAALRAAVTARKSALTDRPAKLDPETDTARSEADRPAALAEPPSPPARKDTGLAAAARIAAMRASSTADKTVPVTVVPDPAPGSVHPTDAAGHQSSAPRTADGPEPSMPKAYPDRGWSAGGAPLGTAPSDAVRYRPIPETPAMRGPAPDLVPPATRPPVPVVVASGLLGLITAGFVVLAMFMATLGPAILLAPLCGATLTGCLAFGLWRGARGANLVTLLLAAIALYTGVSNLLTGAGGGAVTALPRIVIGGALFGLLLGHRETRRHYWT